MFYNEYVNGHIQRENGGRYTGQVRVDGIDLSPIEATFFEEEGKKYLWLKRQPIKEYDWDTSSFKTRHPKPHWEAYLEKQMENNTIAYKGKFTFLRFRYEISAVWDNKLGLDKNRMNLYIERLPLNEQTILTSINERKLNDDKER